VVFGAAIGVAHPRSTACPTAPSSCRPDHAHAPDAEHRQRLFGIYFPRFTGTIYELLSAPISYVEITLGYVGAAATKSIILGAIILLTAALFVPLRIEHPVWMVLFLVLTAVTFSLFGFIIGIGPTGSRSCSSCRSSSSRRSPSSAAASTRSTCCRPSGAR
jgi:hypothetical protein